MNADTIFQPMLAMMLLTAVVWLYMYSVRIPAMKKARVNPQVYTTPEKVIELLPDSVSYPAYNLKNLFELPVLFYVLCLYLFVSGNVDEIYVVAAWSFFVFRVLHSVVHCTKNIVMLRFYMYCGAALSLWFMLGRVLLGVVLA